MNLTEYLEKTDYTDRQLGDYIGVTRAYIGRIRSGDVNPSLSVALAIQKFSDGEVELETMVPRRLRLKLGKKPKPDGRAAVAAMPKGKPPAKKGGRPGIKKPAPAPAPATPPVAAPGSRRRPATASTVGSA